MRQIAL